MQSVSSRIWTRVAVSISYDDNHYTTGTSCSFIIARMFTTQSLADANCEDILYTYSVTHDITWFSLETLSHFYDALYMHSCVYMCAWASVWCRYRGICTLSDMCNRMHPQPYIYDDAVDEDAWESDLSSATLYQCLTNFSVYFKFVTFVSIETAALKFGTTPLLLSHRPLTLI